MPDRHHRTRSSKVTLAHDPDNENHDLAKIIETREVYGKPGVLALSQKKEFFGILGLSVTPIADVLAAATNLTVSGKIDYKDAFLSFTLKYWDADSTSWSVPNPSVDNTTPHHNWSVTFTKPSGGANNYTFEIIATHTVTDTSTNPPTTVTMTDDVTAPFKLL